MFDFQFISPTRIVFGRNAIDQLTGLIDPGTRVLLLYGGGSIMENGVYDKVSRQLDGYQVETFGGIQPNPKYETCMQAVELCREKDIQFLLPVGGGSVLDAAKFIAAAADFEGDDPWQIVEQHTPFDTALPIGTVLTLPATGSETNPHAVISRAQTKQKLAFHSEKVFPQFAVLDPTTTFSLPKRQTANGVVDAFVHVCEQYITYPVNAPLQDRQAEAILLTLIENGPIVMDKPEHYDARANVMWCATQALNRLIACGVPIDFATHAIGHEITGLYEIDHAQTLAVVMPALWRYRRQQKAEKLIQYAERVWGLATQESDMAIDRAIDLTIEFFQSLGMKTKLSDLDLPDDACEQIAQRIDRRVQRSGKMIGEHNDIAGEQVREILAMAE